MTTNQILIGVGLILALAAGSQVLASRLRIPAIIVLLPAGFVAGALTSDVNPQDLLGPAFEPLVSLSVAVILYDAGLSLDMRKLKGHTRKVVIRLIVLGVLITWVLAASLAAPLLGMSRGAAVMLGIILVVSGPTVVGPLLSFVRPTERLQQVLIWEGSLIDPVAESSARWCSMPLSRVPARDRAASFCSSRSASASAWPAAWPAPRCSGCCSAGSGSVKCSAPPRSSPQ